ncbi:MAG: Gldg family protein [Clostridia bacterium]|nr:Gldg family protein [Clostridia bacterium]
MSAIFKRELKSYFTSPLGFIVVLVYILMGGILFSYMFRSGYAQIEGVFSYMSNFSYLLVPVLTMRLFSEERHAKTDQALLTAPIKISHIVMGKFFAALAVLGIVNGITLIYQFIFSVMVSVNWVTYLSCLLGTMLFSAALVALGLFISALTENQMVAAMGSVAASLVLMMTDTIASLLSSIEILYNSLTWLSFATRYNTFINGLFNYADVAFFASFAAIFLFLTVRVIERRRWAGGSKEQSYALIALLTAAAAVVCGISAVKQFISYNSNSTTSTLTVALVFAMLAVTAVVVCVWSIIKFLRILSSRKKGTVVVKLDQKGEWKCPVCGAQNTDRNNFCVKCDIQRVSNEAQKATKFKRGKKRKHSAYALVLTAVFVGVVIGLNVAASALSEAYPLTLDLTTNKDYSISEENLKYIEKINRDVTITVCADKEEYSDGTYANLITSNGVFDTSSGVFFTQTEKLLKEYEMRNKHISLQYVDPQSTDFTKYSSKYPSEDFTTGDILIECEFELDGKKIEHYRHLDAFDLYKIESTQENQKYYKIYYSGYSYVLSSSNIETAITSSIYAVTSDKTLQVALITANGGKTVDALQALMQTNNYTFFEIDNLVTKNIPQDTDLVIIAAPTMDYSESELKKLDDFLDLDGKLGKNIIYIPDASQGNKVPNLTAFIGEWGFKINSGYAFATDDSTYYYSPNMLYGTADAESKYLDMLGDEDYIYLCEQYTAVNVAFKEQEKRQTEVLVSLPESAVCVPIDADNDWKIEDADVKGPFVALGISHQVGYDEDYNESYSNVMVVGGMNFIESGFNSQSSVGNLKAILAAVNYMFDVKGDGISFDSRTLSSSTFETTGKVSTFMYVLFVAIIPIAIIVTCIVVYIRRKHL